MNNRLHLRKLFTGTAPIVITANGLLQRNNDTTFPFRQDSNFWYLTGIEVPDVVLILDKDHEYLIVPGRSDNREAFDGSVEAHRLKEISGIDTVLEDTAGWKQLEKRLKILKQVASFAAPSSYIEAHGLYTNPARHHLLKRLMTFNPDLEILDIRRHMIKLRSIKQPQEIAAIRQAIDITTKTLQDTMKLGWESFGYEFEVEAAINSGFRKKGVYHAYSPIVASGGNACTLHYIHNHTQLDRTGLLLIDVGAEVNNYAADITRTYALGVPSKRQSQVHSAVLAAQDYALSLLKPGVIMKEYEQEIERFMGEQLLELGLIKNIDHENVRMFCPHSTSHFLGLDVHDIADYDKPLEAGMVLTVEPGIYIASEHIGVRIEDDVLITETGIEVLSNGLSKGLS